MDDDEKRTTKAAVRRQVLSHPSGRPVDEDDAALDDAAWAELVKSTFPADQIADQRADYLAEQSELVFGDEELLDLTPPDDGIVLTEEQKNGVDAVLAAIDAGAILATLTGRQGTGKTTCGRRLREELERRARRAKVGGWVLFMAPTWRALLQARAKSRVPAATSRTLHAGIYTGPDLSLEEQIEAAEERIRGQHKLWTKESGAWEKAPFTEEAQAELDAEIEAIRGSFEDAGPGQVSFSNPRIWDPEECPVYIVVDEAGMVPVRILDHLREAFGDVPVIGVGDWHQLGPVKGKPAFDLENATARLTTSHRQAEGSPIHAMSMWLADRMDEGKPVNLGRRHDIWKRFGFPVLRSTSADVGTWLARNAERDNEVMCLVPRHKVRRAINEAVRRAEGRGHTLMGPQVGERVLFRGHGAGGAVNGEFGTVRAVGPALQSTITHGVYLGRHDTARLLDVIPTVIELDRMGQSMTVAGGVIRGAWHPKDPKDEGRLPRDYGGLGARLAREQGRVLSLSPSMINNDYWRIKKEYLATHDEVSASLGAVNAVLSSAPLFGVLKGGFALPIAPGRASTTWVAQGSDYPRVMIVLESLRWLEDAEPNYWYTAVGRASEALYPVVLTDRI